jgi:hypothetical protein
MDDCHLGYIEKHLKKNTSVAWLFVYLFIYSIIGWVFLVFKFNYGSHRVSIIVILWKNLTN